MWSVTCWAHATIQKKSWTEWFDQSARVLLVCWNSYKQPLVTKLGINTPWWFAHLRNTMMLLPVLWPSELALMQSHEWIGEMILYLSCFKWFYKCYIILQQCKINNKHSGVEQHHGCGKEIDKFTKCLTEHVFMFSVFIFFTDFYTFLRNGFHYPDPCFKWKPPCQSFQSSTWKKSSLENESPSTSIIAKVAPSTKSGVVVNWQGDSIPLMICPTIC